MIIICFGEQKETSLTEAGLIFQLGCRWLLVSQRPEEGSVFKAFYDFFQVVFPQIPIWFPLCKMYSFPAETQVFPCEHPDFTTWLD